MKKNLLRQALLFFILLTGGLGGCSMMTLGSEQVPSVTLINLMPGKMGLLAQEFQLELLIQNPNPFPLPMQGMSYTLQLNGENFANGVSSKAVEVPAFGQQALTVSVTSSVTRIFQQLRNAFGGAETKDFSYELVGKLHLSNKMMPLSFTTRDEISLKDF